MATFHLSITGIVSFVPEPDHNRVGVIVLDTTKSADGSDFLYDDLVAHVPVLKIRARDRVEAESPELLGTRWEELDIRRTRLHFEFDHRPRPLSASLRGVPRIDAAFETAKIDGDALNGDCQAVYSQLALSGGRLFSSSDVKKWAFKREWSDTGGAELSLSSKSVWEVDDVTRVNIVRTPIDGSAGADETVLVSREGADIELELSNLCISPPERPADWRKMADRDFRWHYELIDAATKDRLRERLQHNEALPIPYPMENPLERVHDVMHFDTDSMCFQALFPEARLGWPLPTSREVTNA